MHFFEHGNFYCYGCGCSGDVFDFITKMLGDRIKDYRWLKKNYGIPLPWEK